jgi:hypothetical protein
MSINFPENNAVKLQKNLKNILKRIIMIICMIISFEVRESLAWTGYDSVDGSEIEIGSGNLVREGQQIRFYDWENEEDRRAEVIDVEYLFNRTRLEIYDYVDQKNRIFQMNSD